MTALYGHTHHHISLMLLRPEAPLKGSVVASSVVTASVDAEVTDCILPDALLATLAVSLADTELPAGTTASMASRTLLSAIITA